MDLPFYIKVARLLEFSLTCSTQTGQPFRESCRCSGDLTLLPTVSRLTGCHTQFKFPISAPPPQCEANK